MAVEPTVNRIDLFVFDLAGTTIADQEGLVPRTFLAVAGDHGIHTDLSELNGLRGRSKAEVLRMLIGRQFGVSESEQRVAAAYADFQSRVLAAFRRECRPIPGAEDAFRFVRSRGAKAAVNSGFDRGIVAVLMERLGWLSAGLVDLAVTADDVPAGRPAPDMILRAMDLLGFSDARRVAKVGDTPADIEEGRNAGCGAIIAVCTGTTPSDQLRSHQPTHILPSVADIPALATREGWL